MSHFQRWCHYQPQLIINNNEPGHGTQPCIWLARHIQHLIPWEISREGECVDGGGGGGGGGGGSCGDGGGGDGSGGSDTFHSKNLTPAMTQQNNGL